MFVRETNEANLKNGMAVEKQLKLIVAFLFSFNIFAIIMLWHRMD